ncbi:MAG: hypothetical protein Q6L50_09945 [Gloeomargarita sp. GMQP_bins_120]
MTMATTLAQISAYLDRMHWRYDLDPERNRIVTGVKTTNLERLLLVIALEEDGEFFKLYAPQVLQIQNHPHQAAALQVLLTIAWETKMVQWEYDPSDGEVRAIIEFPLEDAPLTERQFLRCLDALVRIVDEKAYPRLQQTLATGEDPGDITDDERFLLEFERQLPGVAERIYRAVLRRKQRMQMQDSA